MAKRTRRQKAIIRRRIFLSCCALCLAALIGIISFFAHSLLSPKNKEQNNPQKQNSGNYESQKADKNENPNSNI